MKVMITGGTGFIGAHTVAALQAAGHDTRLLVRSPERVEPALKPLAVEDVDIVTGDVTDPASVREAMVGCDAVVHAASVYSLDRRRDAEVRQTNVSGTETVLGEASRRGLDPIVYVSSIAALVTERDATLHPDATPGKPPGTYLRSKADAEWTARRLQEEGAPVAISYPSVVWGPHDPHFGESAQVTLNSLKGAYRFAVKGRAPLSDVQDVAALHARLVEPGSGPRRFLVPSTRLSLADILSYLSDLTGRKLSTLPLPPQLVLPPMLGMDLLQRVAPFRLPFNYQSTYVVSLNVGWDDSRTRQELGLEPSPIRETFANTLRWLYEDGHASAKLVGAMARSSRDVQ